MTPVSEIKTNFPFHQGELDVQELTGEKTAAMNLTRLILNSIPTRVLGFIRQQSVIWIGIEGNNGCLWAFPLFGSPGFINPDKETRLEIYLNNKFSIPDEWRSTLQKGKQVGCLVIDLSTRTRIRINGIIRGIRKNILLIDVQQAYPNCLKYIRRREFRGNAVFSEFTVKSSGTELDEQSKRIINCSDTAFVTSKGPNGADISHRGGSSGFIKHHRSNKLLVPDFKGNGMFNTLGNFKSNPHGGMIIVDFSRDYYLQLNGKISLSFDKKISRLKTGGTNRFWELKVSSWYLFQLKSSFRWNNLDFSPYNP